MAAGEALAKVAAIMGDVRKWRAIGEAAATAASKDALLSKEVTFHDVTHTHTHTPHVCWQISVRNSSIFVNSFVHRFLN
jgi:hypothetical protein